MSIEVPMEQLFADLQLWGAGFFTTVGDDGRPRFVCLTPTVEREPGGRMLALARAGRTASANVLARPEVSIVFPPHAGSAGYSLIVDGVASVAADRDSTILLRPTWAVQHRPAP